jgi:L-asparaginase II
MAVRSASRSASAASRPGAGRAKSPAKPAKWTMPPVLVRQVRNGTVESVHRGDIVEVDAAGRMLHVIGDPDRVVNLRSAMKPFGLIALLRAGGRREFDLTGEELAVMTSSHSG